MNAPWTDPRDLPVRVPVPISIRSLSLIGTLILALSGGGFLLSAQAAPASDPAPLSPSALAVHPDARTLYVACGTSPRVLVVDTASRALRQTILLKLPVTGLALSRDQRRLHVTCAGPVSEVCVIDTGSGTVTDRIPAGHTAMSPVLSMDGATLFVCDRFDDAIGVIDLAARREIRRIQVRREPVAAALTPDGRHLLVANHLHAGRADRGHVGAVISVVDVEAGRVVKELQLPNGSGGLNDLQVSPDGRYAVVTHVLARFHLPTTQLERGWMNTNAETLIDLATLEVLNTVLLDAVNGGAANPWGVAWTPDGRTQVVAHAGTHEVSLIDFPALLTRLQAVPATPDPRRNEGRTYSSRARSEVPDDLAFLVGIRQRVRLPDGARGPRAVAVAGGRIYTANYFSDSLTELDAAAAGTGMTSIPLGPSHTEPSLARRGEALFHDADICFQGWQSCASCHPGDARVDALNWDLLNDDIGNPKNNKSLLLSHRTPPAMSLGVRESAEMAVRAGIRHILFTVQPDSVAQSMDAYLKSLQPVPSPHLKDGKLSGSARRGRRIFESTRTGCATCHPPGLFTDQKHYDVGTRARSDGATDIFDTPTLIEIWRTAPYLHDGSMVSLHELFTAGNPDDRHGRTSHLTPRQLDDLVTYLLSL